MSSGRSPPFLSLLTLYLSFILHAVRADTVSMDFKVTFTLMSNQFYAVSTLMLQRDGLMVLGGYSDNHVMLYDLHTNNVLDGWSNVDSIIASSYVEGTTYASSFYVLTQVLVWRAEVNSGATGITYTSMSNPQSSSTAFLAITDVKFVIGAGTTEDFSVKLITIDNWTSKTVQSTLVINPTGITNHLKLGAGIILIGGNYPEIKYTDTDFSFTSQISACVGTKMMTAGLTIDKANNFAYELAAWGTGSQMANHELVVGTGYNLRNSVPGPMVGSSIPCAGLLLFPSGNHLLVSTGQTIQIYIASTLEPVLVQTSLPFATPFKANSLTARGHIDSTTPNFVDFSLVESTGLVYVVKVQVKTAANVASPSNPKLEVASFVKETRTALVLFSEAIKATSIAATSLSIDIFDLVESISYNCAIPQACTITFHSSGFSILVNLPGTNILRGRMTISLSAGSTSPIASADGTRYFTDFPITVEDIVLADTSSGTAKTLSSFSETSSTIVEVGRSATQLITSFSRPGAAVGLDRLISELLYLRVVDGPNMFFPDLVLDSHSGSNILPFDIGNPLLDESSPLRVTSVQLPKVEIDDAESCTLSKYFSSNSVKCNILINFGEDLVTTLAILILNLAVSLTFLLAWLKKPSNYEPTSLCGRLFAILGRSYGVKYFFTKIDGMSLEIMIYAAINGLNPDKNVGVLFAGFFISWIIFLVYIGYGALLVIFILKVRKELKAKKVHEIDEMPSKNGDRSSDHLTSNHQNHTVAASGSLSTKQPLIKGEMASPENSQVKLSPRVQQNAEKRDEENVKESGQKNKKAGEMAKREKGEKKEEREEIGEAVKLYSIRYWVVGGVVEELKVPNRDFILFTPLVTLIRNLLLSFVLYACSSRGVLQVILLLVIQGLGLAWTLAFLPKFSRIDNIKESSEQILSFLYLFLKLISLFNISESARQKSLGGIMAILLVLMILLNLIYSFYTAILMIWELISGMKELCKSKHKKTETTVSNNKVAPVIKTEPQVNDKLLSKRSILQKQADIAKQSFQSPGVPTQNLEIAAHEDWPEENKQDPVKEKSVL
jgi:hypothetical protein